MLDVIIVGGGPAGLATAYNLEHAGMNAVLLESTSRCGGRALTRHINGESVNLGAMFVYSGTPTHDLALHLGLDLTPFVPTTMGIHVNGQTVVSADNSALVNQLALPQASKEALSTFFEASKATYFANTEEGRLAPASAALTAISAQEQLDGLPADVQEILVAAIRGGSVAHPSELSATYALRYFASYLVHEKNNRMVLTDGMEAIPNELERRLARTEVRKKFEVTSVRQENDRTWSVEGIDHNKNSALPTHYRARHVVLSVPAPVIDDIVELPTWKREALSQVRTPGSTVLGVVVDVSDIPATNLTESASNAHSNYDDWSFVITPGRPFDAIINPQPGRRSGIVQFACYGNVSGWVEDANDPNSGVLEQWVEEFLAVAPGLRGRILGAEIRSWKHCFSLLTPERNAVIEDLRRPVNGSLHFAGDYSSETAGTHGAYAEAQRVADAIIEARVPGTASV
jgi:protoporphyrinogen oxidase